MVISQLSSYLASFWQCNGVLHPEYLTQQLDPISTKPEEYNEYPSRCHILVTGTAQGLLRPTIGNNETQKKDFLKSD